MAGLRMLVVTLLVLLGGCGKREATPSPVPAARTTAAAPAATVAAAPAAPKPAQANAVFVPGELDQMVAPIALYPDALLAQVLMAATYPGDVADAAKWSKLHMDKKGDEAVRLASAQPWDPSVQSLVAFPQALATLGQDPAWVQRLGDAFLAQPDGVMDAVQRLRRQARAAGNLESNEYQKISAAAEPPAPAMGAPGGESYAAPAPTIVIEPANPEVIYVPTYDPTTAYGTWSDPMYPPVYYPPAAYWYPGRVLGAGLAFGAGIAIGNALWGDMDWHGNDININASRYNSINVNRQANLNGNTWRHEPLHRDGVPYRDQGSRERYDRTLPGAEHREAFRGDDPQRAQARDRARTSMEQRGVERPGSGTRNASQRVADIDRDAHSRERAQLASRERAQAAQARRETPRQSHQPRDASTSQSRQIAQMQYASREGPRNNAFQGAGQASQARAERQRGEASRGNYQRQGGQGSQGGGRAASRPSQPVSRPQSQPRQGGGGRRR